MFPGEDDEDDLDGNRASSTRHSRVDQDKRSTKSKKHDGEDEEGFESELVGHSEQILGEINQAQNLIGMQHHMVGMDGSANRRYRRVQHSPPNDGSTSARRYPDKTLVNLGESFMQPNMNNQYAPFGQTPGERESLRANGG